MADLTLIADAASLCLAANVPVLFWGSPGTGKSTIAALLAERLGFEPIRLHVHGMEPESFVVEYLDRESGKLRLALAPEIDLAVRKPAALILDEINARIRPGVRPLLQHLLAERQIRLWKLHPETRIIATANPTDSGAEATPMAPAFVSRFCLIQLESDSFNAAWLHYAAMAEEEDLNAGILPEELLPWDTDLTAKKLGVIGTKIAARAVDIGIKPVYNPEIDELAEGIPVPQPSNRTIKFLVRLFAAAQPLLGHEDAGVRERAKAALQLAAFGVFGHAANQLMAELEKPDDVRVIEALKANPPKWEELAKVTAPEWPSVAAGVARRAAEEPELCPVLARLLLWLYGNGHREVLQSVNFTLAEWFEKHPDQSRVRPARDLVEVAAEAVRELGAWHGSRTSPTGQLCLSRLAAKGKLDAWPPSRPEHPFRDGYHGCKIGKIL